MPVGGVGLGFASGLADYVQQQREQQRQHEDQQLSYQMELIKSLANRPDINERPEVMGQAIHDMLSLSAAKGGKNPQKKGMEGFMGAHDLPMSQFLAGLSSGARPMVGPTEELRPDIPSEGNSSALQRTPDAGPPQQGLLPSAPTMGASELGQSTPQAPTGGTSILSAPIAMPPMGVHGPPEAVRLIEAGRGMQAQATINPPPPVQSRPLPSAQQPYFVSSEERASKAGDIKRSEETKTRQLDTQNRQQEGQRMGLTGTALQDYTFNGKLPTAGAKGQQSKKLGVLVTPDGQQVFAVDTFDPNTGKHVLMDEYGRPIPPGSQPPPPKPGTAGAGYQQHLIQQPDGSYEIIYGLKDPTATGSTVAPVNGSGVPSSPSNGQSGVIPPPPSSSAPINGPGSPKPGIVVAPTGVKGKLPQPPQGNIITMVGPDGQPVFGRSTGTNVKPLTGPNGEPVAKPENTKLNNDEQNFVDMAQGVKPVMGRIEKLITGAGLQNSNDISAWASQKGQNWIRQMGFEPTQFNADLQQQTGYIRATLLRSLLGGRPNRQITEIFESHLPKEFQTPAMIMNTLKLVKQEIADRYAGIETARGMKLPSLGMGEQSNDADFAKFVESLKRKPNARP